MALAGLVARRAWWGTGPNGASTTPASVARVSLADVRALHQRAAHPMLTTVVFTGDLDLAQGRALAQRHFGDWPATRIALPEAPPSPPQPLDVPMLLVNLPGAGQAGVVVMGPGVPQADPQRRTAQVAAGVLGGGYSARVNVEVRIKRGLSYGASAALSMAAEGGVVAASAQTQNATAAEVAALMRGEMLRLGRDAPGPEEFDARLATLVGNVTRQAETTAGLAAMAIDTVERARPLADLARAVPELRTVTAAQVRDFAAATWRPEALRIVVVGDMKVAGEALRAMVPGARLIDAAALDLAAPSMTR
jgi:zinc protease